jgi:hypothetical protein
MSSSAASTPLKFDISNLSAHPSGTSTPLSYEVEESGGLYVGRLINAEHLIHVATPSTQSRVTSPIWSSATSAASSTCNSPRGLSQELINEKVHVDEQEDLSIPKPLNHKWYAYYDERDINNSFGQICNDYTQLYETFFQNSKKIGQFSTVQEFWKLWNAVNVPYSQQTQNLVLKFFKKSINDEEGTVVEMDNGTDPVEDHPVIRPGGKWTLFSYDRNKRQKIWTELMLAAIGEVDYFGRRTFDIQGLIFKCHQNYDSVQIWNGVPQITEQNAKKMMKRLASLIKHANDGTDDEPLASIGENLFLEYFKSHFSQGYSYNSSKSNSGYNSPSSKSGYSSPSFGGIGQKRGNSTSWNTQYSPRMSYAHFHNKLHQKLQQRFPESVTTPGATQQSNSLQSSSTVISAAKVEPGTNAVTNRNFAEKQRRVSLTNGKSEIVNVQDKDTVNSLIPKQAASNDKKSQDFNLRRYLKFFLVFFFAIALKVSE